jgi:hypothetical protein
MVVIIFITSGCISQGSVTVSDFDQKLKTIGDISSLKKEDAKGLERLYGINKTELEDFVLYTSKSKNSSEEILVLKVKYLSSIGDLRYRIEKRLNVQAEKFKESSPEEYKIIKNDLLEDRQNFIVFVISKDKAAIEKQFHKMVQN